MVPPTQGCWGEGLTGHLLEYLGPSFYQVLEFGYHVTLEGSGREETQTPQSVSEALGNLRRDLSC